MKNLALTLSALVLLGTAAIAKKKTKVATPNVATQVAPVKPVTAPQSTPAPVAAPGEADKHMKFVVTDYDFKSIPEGPQATAEFKFKNIGNDIIELQNVQASCGCTVPEWTKEAIKPGKTATIKAVYNTQGRPGPFTKSLTITTKQGYNKIITIKGNVEKAATSSVPANTDNMMIKH
jgi:hypothetical protein